MSSILSPLGRPMDKELRSPEEQKLWESCAQEVFLNRSLPWMVILGGSSVLAQVSGQFPSRSITHFVGRTLLGMWVGMSVGGMSVISHCQERFLRELPESNESKRILAIRKHGKDWQRYLKEESEAPTPSEPRVGGGTTYDQLREQHRAREAARINPNFGYIASGLSTVKEAADEDQGDSDLNPKEQSGKEGGGVTYAQLREQHRRREIEKFNSSFGYVSGGLRPKQEAASRVPDSSERVKTKTRKNQYGDEVIMDD